MANVSVGVTVTNPNPVRTMVPCATVSVQRSIDGLSYVVTKPDGTVVAGVPLWFVDAFLMAAPGPRPIIDRPKGASAS